MPGPRLQVAFFRDLNHGQRGSPTRDQLLAAFAEARATDVETVQANGTVIFRAKAPRHTLDRACTYLLAETEWFDCAYVRSATWVRQLARELGDVGDHAEVAIFDAGRDLPVSLPYRPERGRITVVQADRRHAIAVNDEPRTSYATPTLERLIRRKVTSRGDSTILRLAQRLG